MPIPTPDKAKGKKHIMGIVGPFVIDLGFTKKPRGEFTLKSKDDHEWRLIFNVPTFAPLYRIYPSIIPRK